MSCSRAFGSGCLSRASGVLGACVLASNLLHRRKRLRKETSMPTHPTQPVLIVEDDPSIREVMEDVLSDEGYHVVTAPHGAAALVCLQQTQPCVILLDLMMPILDGFGFRRIQRETPQFATIPVIVMSAFPANVETVVQLDAAAYLRKPIPLERLVATVERYCRAE